MSMPLSIIKRELEGTGYKTLVVPGLEVGASTKTDALRAVRNLQKVISQGKLKGITYAALYGIYELARLRAKGKKLSDGQKAAITLTFQQLRKIGVWKRVKNLFSFGKRDEDPNKDVQELEDWMKSDEGFGPNPEDEEPEEEVQKPQPRARRGWKPRQSVAEVPFEEHEVRASVNPADAVKVVRKVEALLKNKAVRGALLTTAYGIYGIMKKSAKSRRVDKLDRQALNDSFGYLNKSNKVAPKLREQLREIQEEYNAAFENAA